MVLRREGCGQQDEANGGATEETDFTTSLSVAIFLYEEVPKDGCCSSKLREGICTFRFLV
ncbi:hypothetical protein F3P66_17875 [Agrobacterium fabrum]|uniref:Uncharacterized protein n=1 Tax=Agrobacterium fabrum (strain C58 / ATCC 33970) TaxID=176299 RepID=Q8U4X0_AGRFC|nr:hypothetical protein Atu8034 [Agrobacterium fabrum str. C58]QRM61308.1 hypothetical protein F3P66_17875 [Agrobacterium fabrum]TRB27191.1 hypothetical protein EXN51_18690 [Agrobacterium fabrum]